MDSIDYIGLDVHKKTITYCIKTASGQVRGEGSVPATKPALAQWALGLERPWVGALEATLFTGWVYDHLEPHAQELHVGHSARLRYIVASKKKNDRVDAAKLADLLRCDLFPDCYMPPKPMRDLRRMLRFRNTVVAQAVRLKNRMAGMLMEMGEPFDKRRLHGERYFGELLRSLEDVPDSVIELLRMSRGMLEMFEDAQRQLLRALREQEPLRERVPRLMTIRAVGEVTGLTWALEVCDPHRFSALRHAVSYCGLCSAQDNSAGVEHRGPISKQRNKHLQTILIEAAKLAPRWNPELAALYERELQRGNRNRATLAVARRLVAYLLAVDKRGTDFVERPAPAVEAAAAAQDGAWDQDLSPGS